jgi:hypothetical protein
VGVKEKTLDGNKTFFSVLIAVLLIQAFLFAVCIVSSSDQVCETTPSIPEKGGLVFIGGCGCPTDLSTFRERALYRSTLVSLLSSEIAASLEEEKLSLLLKSGGKKKMSNEKNSSGIDTLKNPKDIDLEERIRRAQERIKLAKKYIYEQELSARLEHLKTRKKQVQKSGT